MSTLKSNVVFNPINLPQIHILGAGAIGSKVADTLTRLGIPNIKIYDFDKVELKNTGNQAFSERHVGMLKVDAVNELTVSNSGINVLPYTKDPDDLKYEGILFLLPDKIEVRQKVLKANKYNPKCMLIIDVRMGLYDGEIYACDPRLPVQVKGYENTMKFTHEDVLPQVASSCGIRQDLCHCSSILAGIAVQKLLDWNLIDKGKDKSMGRIVMNETFISFKDHIDIMENYWK